MKNNGKNRSEADSYSVSEAAAILGVSGPTVKRMVAEGRLEAYRTPGNHLRTLAESVEAMREGRQRATPRPVREASPVLQNRRERLEELTLEAQEHRAKRELAKLRREEQEEAEQREAEHDARQQEAEQRQAELELERERLEHERAMEEQRLAQDLAQDRRRREAKQALAAFRLRWLDRAAELLSNWRYDWLGPVKRKEVLDCLEVEIENRQPTDEPRMESVLARSLEALVQPLQAQNDAQERRQTLTQTVLWTLPFGATEAEKVRATAAIREALGRFDTFAGDREMRVAAEEAIRPLSQAIERRKLVARLLDWAVGELPWGQEDHDRARLRRECTEILAELPQDETEAEAKEALETIVAEACREIEKREAQKELNARKASLIDQGAREVSSYLLELKTEDEISTEDYWDSELRASLAAAVRQELESGLTGDESSKEVRELAREVIDGELE